jgi:hypothetical protein
MLILQPKTVFPGSQTGAAKLALTGDDPLEMVDTMHAEIELLMLSAGVTRDVAVKMLLSKVAKEKALQQQGGVSNKGFLVWLMRLLIEILL